MLPEESWHAAADPDQVLRLVWPGWDGSYSPRAHETTGPLARRLRLFAAACARQVWELLPREARSAVEISERLADGRAGVPDLRAAVVRAEYGSTPAALARSAALSATAFNFLNNPGRAVLGSVTIYWDPLDAARYAARALATHAAGQAPRRRVPDTWHDAWNAAFHAARAVQADFVRDIFPPPGVAPPIRPAWLTTAVLGLARTMDETGDFSAAPILADALQDAGCDDAEILNRLRHPGPHVRGCWPVDLVLGRG
jgi:hypothetical protein